MIISPLEFLAAFVLIFVCGVICGMCRENRRVVVAHA